MLKRKCPSLRLKIRPLFTLLFTRSLYIRPRFWCLCERYRVWVKLDANTRGIYYLADGPILKCLLHDAPSPQCNWSQIKGYLYFLLQDALSSVPLPLSAPPTSAQVHLLRQLATSLQHLKKTRSHYSFSCYSD